MADRRRIYTCCIDPENGKCLAFAADNPSMQAVTYASREHAFGLLLNEYGGYFGIQLTDVDRPEAGK